MSQNEIDNLLNSIISGNNSEIDLSTQSNSKVVKEYNFARPSKFNKEQLRTLGIIYDNYSRMLTSFLTGYLRTDVRVEVANAEQITFNDFTNSLANPTIIAIVNLEPFEGSIILDLSPSIGYAIIDRILGGSGTVELTNKELSDIEKILLEKVFSQMLSFMPECWENIIETNPILDKIETNIQFAQILPPNEVTALITLNVQIGGVKGYFNFCIPYILIEPIVQKLNTTNWFISKDDENKNNYLYKEQIEDRLEKTYVDISVEIGRTTIVVNDFINLQKGDIIQLDTYKNSNLNIKVGNLLKFIGKPGISKGKNSVKIISTIREEE